MTDELKPCPFCPTKTVVSVIDTPDTGRWLVGCGACGATTGHHWAMEEAIAAWNTRHIDGELMEALQRIVIIRQDSGTIFRYDLVNSCVGITQKALEKTGMRTENK
jgi:Lar family restriction alleviation protein